MDRVPDRLERRRAYLEEIERLTAIVGGRAGHINVEDANDNLLADVALHMKITVNPVVTQMNTIIFALVGVIQKLRFELEALDYRTQCLHELTTLMLSYELGEIREIIGLFLGLQR
ncbi:hypothetical protein A0H81_09013 [Grifola frondosa]|uniref:Uncharacterized protein n=1 Tax=Grifola frondosa TaxID=5627 RepID=A0A1C7M3H9_GRIFR|nr:hypothetical protein A0H81_09013 [Grifola frondosa]